MTPKLRIAILSRNPKFYPNRRLVEPRTALGHQVDVIDTMHCYMDITSGQSSVRYNGKPIPYYDVVIQRILVRHGVSFDLADLLFIDIKDSIDFFKKHPIQIPLSKEEASGFSH